MTASDHQPDSAGAAAAPEKPATLGQAFGCAFGAMMIGLILVPILVFFGALMINAFDSACGRPGDSGGCEMWAGGLALTVAIPAAAIGTALGLWFGLHAWWRGRKQALNRDSAP